MGVETTDPVTTELKPRQGLDSLYEMANSFIALAPMMAIGLVVIVAFYFIAKLVSRLVKGDGSDKPGPGRKEAYARMAYAAIIAVGVLIGLTIAFPSVSPAELLSVLGVGGVAIGFAFKDIFQNLIAGIFLLIRQPFEVGDEITSGDITGKVEAIKTRATYIRTYDGKRVIVPNSIIYTEPVTVITAYDKLRNHVDIGIGYGDDVDEARDLALSIARGTDGVLDDPAPDALVWELGGSSLNIRLRWWTDPARGSVIKVADVIMQKVRDEFTEAGIDLPYPTSVVLFHDQTEETDGDRTRQREGWPAAKGENPDARPINHVRLLEGGRSADKNGAEAASSN